MRPEGSALRPGIDEIDDRVLQRGVKVGGTEEQPVDIGFAVVSFYVKGFGCDPSRGFQACDIAVCQLFDHLTGAIAQQHDLGLLRRGVDIDDEFSVAGYGCHVIGVLRRKQLQVLAVQVRTIDAPVVGIFRWLTTHAGQDHLARLLVYVEYLIDVPVALRNRMLQLSCAGVV